MGRTRNRADLLLLDAGSIMVILFGTLTLLFLTIQFIGGLLHQYATLVSAAAAISFLLTLTGLGFLTLSTHT